MLSSQVAVFSPPFPEPLNKDLGQRNGDVEMLDFLTEKLGVALLKEETGFDYLVDNLSR